MIFFVQEGLEVLLNLEQSKPQGLEELVIRENRGGEPHDGRFAL